jgi:BCCT family betaine/carnitine transporter
MARYMQAGTTKTTIDSVPDHQGRDAGRDNIRVLGLDFHYFVFPLSALLVLGLVLLTLLYQEAAARFFGELKTWTTAQSDWFFMVSANIVLVFLAVIALTKSGKIRLGGAQAKPEYSYPVWLAMLFAAGVGIGLMFFGVLEPVTHTLRPPLGVEAGMTDAARSVGMAAAIYHWGLHAWGIYAVVGLALAYFCFNHGRALTLRSTLHPLIGDRIRGWPGHLVDILAVLATLFGLATSLGIGAEQIAAGLHYLLGIGISNGSKVVIILVITSVALVSVIAGLEKGVKRLSEINMVLAAILLLFVLSAGPTMVILATIGNSLADYLTHLPALSSWIGREDSAFFQDWTTFYWAWWVSWSPFVGMFIARISYGRTIREFIAWVLVVPTLICVIWMSVFGGTALDQLFSNGYRGVADTVPELALFKMLEQLPFTALFSGLGVILIAIFFVTSADSGSLVLDAITAGGKMNAPIIQRAFWCIVCGLVAIALLLGGGLVSLQAMTIFIGLPFTVLILILMASLAVGLRNDYISAQT